MSLTRVGFRESLEKSVIDAERCVGCGACTITCPFNCLEYREEKPSLTKECQDCGICAKTCPQYQWHPLETEKSVFCRERRSSGSFGIFNRIVATQTTDSAVLGAAQDGGLVTTLLLFALNGGLIDGAIVSGTAEEKPLLPIPRLVTTSREILECAGTRYFYSANILALPEAAKKAKALAFVGTPCQVRAVRKMQATGLKKSIANIKLLIGLMCSECFVYEGLMKEIQEKLGIERTIIKKMNIKGKMLITTEQGTQTLSLTEAKKHVRANCRSCEDFSSELADISAGGLGLDQWTLAIIRTGIGEDLFSKVLRAGLTKVISPTEGSLDLLRRLSEKKKILCDGTDRSNISLRQC